MRFLTSDTRLFLFFFKQKTAYELRISDWSSDVCSSYLAVVVPHCRVAAVERDGSGHRLVTAQGPVLAREVIVATNGYTGAATPWMRRRVIPIGSYIIATEALPKEQMDRLMPTDRRSEENKTELQSLMRRSSAVFCS